MPLRIQNYHPFIHFRSSHDTINGPIIINYPSHDSCHFNFLPVLLEIRHRISWLHTSTLIPFLVARIHVSIPLFLLSRNQ